MGIYINGMKMPQNCFSCDLGKFFSDGGPYCDRLKRAVMSGLQRPDWCPLIPAPDHGRLIDADALETAMFNDPYQDFVHVLAQLPTIIPADKEANDG